MKERILLVLGADDSGSMEAAAFAYAKEHAAKVVALQVLTSSLYHYGRNDLVATRPSKRDFLLYVRSEIVERGKAEAARLVEAANHWGVDMEIVTVESEDVTSTVLAEAEKGYGAVFVPKQKRKLFPLLQRSLHRELQKRATCRVVVG